MRNLTISVEEEVARWARIWAAEHDTSVSKLLGEMLRRRMLEEEGYEAAKNRYLSLKPTALKRSGRYPSREELHDRDRLR
jgi:hypothetical protein